MRRAGNLWKVMPERDKPRLVAKTSVARDGARATRTGCSFTAEQVT